MMEPFSAPLMSTGQARSRSALSSEALVTLIAVPLIAALAIHRLRGFPYHLSWRDAFHGVATVLPDTGWAAIKVWSFFAAGIAVAAGILLKLDSAIDLADALAGGAATLWVASYILGQALGPLGLFRGVTIWILLAAGALWLWWRPPVVRASSLTPGHKLAFLAVGLLAVSMLPLQLGAPVPPYMDVLSYPSSVQRIVTFGVYLPFDNDPYGLWGAYAQTPALELFYAAIAMGSHTRIAALAESAAMLPMAALIIFATWRLGAALIDDAAGGIAGLLLFLTLVFRRAQGMRGTAIDFALLAIALAFFIERRSRVLTALAACALGTAVASHTIDGALAMGLAVIVAIYWLAGFEVGQFARAALYLLGAMLIALPEFAIALRKIQSWPVLPLAQLIGIGVIVLAARTSAPAAPGPSRAVRWINRAVLLALVAGILYRHASGPNSFYEEISARFPILFMLAVAGLAALAWLLIREPDSVPWSGIFCIALLIPIIHEYAWRDLAAILPPATANPMLMDFGNKLMEYWCPYFLVFPAALFIALLFRRWSPAISLLALLALLIYPWHQQRSAFDYDSEEHSIAELWAFNLATAAQGYFVGAPDRRWTFGRDEFALIDTLQAEIAAGRITPATHILHLTRDTLWWKLVQFPVLTGINDDPISYSYDPNDQWLAGSRVRGLGDLKAALDAKPPYILEQTRAPIWVKQPPDGYSEIFQRGALRLFRRAAD